MTKRPIGGASICVWVARWRSLKITPKLIACATSRASAMTKAIWPIRLLGRSRLTGRASQPLHVRREHVAAAPHGLDQLRIGRIFLDLLPEAADMVIDAALERGELAALAEVEQLVAAEHSARVGREGVEEAVLAGGKRDGDIVLADQLALAALQEPGAEAVGVGVRGAHAGLAGAAQHRLHPGEQLARGEGLGDVIVRADLQADHAVHLLRLGGEQDDWDRGR